MGRTVRQEVKLMEKMERQQMLVQTRLDQTMERLRNTERAVLEVGKKIWEVGSEVKQISLRLAYDPKEIMEVKPKKGG